MDILVPLYPSVRGAGEGKKKGKSIMYLRTGEEKKREIVDLCHLCLVLSRGTRKSKKDEAFA